MNVFNYQTGHIPLIISMPHAGSYIPDEIAMGMTAMGQKSIDTDWYVDRLYDFAKQLDVYWIQANYSRYVIDLNRPSDDSDLYPGRDTTSLCPISTFANEPIYQNDSLPDKAEISQRITSYWQPYHQQLDDLIDLIRQQYGYVLVLEAHTIASHVPRFFEGQLSDFNFGTNQGHSCATELVTQLRKLDYSDYTVVFDDVFKGGYITRHYGKPEDNIHILQLELSQAVYLFEARNDWSSVKARECQPVLDRLIKVLMNWRPL